MLVGADGTAPVSGWVRSWFIQETFAHPLDRSGLPSNRRCLVERMAEPSTFRLPAEPTILLATPGDDSAVTGPFDARRLTDSQCKRGVMSENESPYWRI